MSRIIAGSRGGRRLRMPASDRTRPTTDLTREALFSAIASWAGTAAAGAEDLLAGLAFADLFAGSGAVGLEAASRGAGPVVLVESDPPTAALARSNGADLGLDVSVKVIRAETFAQTQAARGFDVVFLDPPYDVKGAQVDALLATLVQRGWIVADGLFVVERSRRSDAPRFPPGFDDGWHKTYGETVLHYAPGREEGPPHC